MIDTYVEKVQHTVEAMQFKRGMDSDELCNFVTDDMEFLQGDGESVISVEMNGCEINDGDWIVKDRAGAYLVFSNADFRSKFTLHAQQATGSKE